MRVPERILGMVSTIIPVYNRAKLLRQAVESVLRQTYRPIEILIVDDGSTDDTLDAAQQLAAAHPDEVIVIQQENGGPGVAREAGRKLARGEFIQYLDSDDVLLPEKFSLQVDGLRSRPDLAVSYGYTRFRHADGSVESEPWKGSGTERDSMFPSFLRWRWWDTPTPLYRASVCDLAGPWTDLRLEEDWEYDCRIAATGARLHFTPHYVAEVRDHGEERLSRGAAFDPERLAIRARAHILVHAHATRAGMNAQLPEVAHFSRALFLLSRQCGAAGLPNESCELFVLSRQIAPQPHGWDYRLYRLLSAALGWKAVGRLSCASDRLRTP